MKDKIIKETIKGDWKIIYISKEDKQIYDELHDSEGNIVKKTNFRRLVDREEYQIIHIPTNKVVKIIKSYEELNAVGSYEYFDCAFFSEDGLYLCTQYGGRYRLSELLK